MRVPLEGLHVLVVEDDPELRALTELILEEEGGVVRGFSLGMEAIRSLDEFTPQVALLDSRLPDTTGVALGRELAARHPDCVQVLVSGDTDGLYEWKSRGHLALPKPYEIDDLVELVRAAAGR